MRKQIPKSFNQCNCTEIVNAGYQGQIFDMRSDAGAGDGLAGFEIGDASADVDDVSGEGVAQWRE